MRLGIITPVFDGCVESLELLYKDLELQKHEDWVWVLCGNKFSENLSRFVNSKKNPNGKYQIIYLCIGYEDEKNVYSMIANIGKRRDFCIKYIDADYIFMFDADAKILDRRMFEIINSELEKNPRSIYMYKVIHAQAGLLPIFPVTPGRIDLLNFCVKASLAKKVGYPTDVDFQIPWNDFRFFSRIYKTCGGDYTLVDKIFCQHNGNNRYETVSKSLNENKAARRSLRNYISYCLRKNHLIGILSASKVLLEDAIVKLKNLTPQT